MLTTKVLPFGSLKAVPSQIGKRLDRCCGSTENVFLTTFLASLLLTDFRLHSGFRKECTQVRLFHPRSSWPSILTSQKLVDYPRYQIYLRRGIRPYSLLFLRFQGQGKAGFPRPTLLFPRSTQSSVHIILRHSFRLPFIPPIWLATTQ